MNINFEREFMTLADASLLFSTVFSRHGGTVSQGFQPADGFKAAGAIHACRLEIGDTAGWKPALLQSPGRNIELENAYRIAMMVILMEADSGSNSIVRVNGMS